MSILISSCAALMLQICCIGPSSRSVEPEPPYKHVVDSLMDTLSLRRKIAQLMVVTADPRYDDARKAEEDHSVRDEQIGGIILMGKDLGPAMQRTNRLQSLASIPLLEFTDAEWGAAMRLSGFQPFPRQAELSKLPDDSLIYRMGRGVAAELAQINIGVNFAPDIDINNNPDNIVIGTRSFGADREKVAAYGAAYARGMQDGGIIACAKHFPGHGDTSVDSHKGLPVLEFSRERLDSLELYPFRKLIDEGVKMVMVGHLCVPALDSTQAPASISKPVVTGILREELGFKGLIICDALNMKGLISRYGGTLDEASAKATLDAYRAGVDILLMPRKVTPAIDLIEKEILDGNLTKEDLDARVRRVLEAKGSLGMLDKDYSKYVDVSKVDTSVNASLIREIRERIAQ